VTRMHRAELIVISITAGLAFVTGCGREIASRFLKQRGGAPRYWIRQRNMPISVILHGALRLTVF